MPHQTLKLIPGVDQNRTPTFNEAAISTTNLVRFIPDKQGQVALVQKLGGWTRFFPTDIGSIVRALWAWEDTNANTYLGVGAEGTTVNGNGLSVIYDNSREVITPRTDILDVVFSGTGGMTTIAGSSTVFVYAVGSNVSDFDTVYVRTPVAVDGLVLFGVYPCTFLGADQFSITAVDALGNPQVATTTVSTPGGAVPTYDLTYDFVNSRGNPIVTVTLANHGYAVGDTFPVVVSTTAGTVTFFGNYIVQTVPTTSTFTIIAGSSTTTAAVTGASSNGTTGTITFSGTYTFNVGDTVTITGVSASYNGDRTVTAKTANSVSFNLGAAATLGAGGTVFDTFSKMNGGDAEYEFFRVPAPIPTGVGYGIGGYGAGGYGTGVVPPATVQGSPINVSDWTLDNWGQIFVACPVGGAIYTWAPGTGATVAGVIPNAPVINDGMFVAMPQRQIIAWGTTFSGIQDPLLIRWCDVNNYDSWIALLTNQAGSYRLPRGSAVIGCIQGPQQGLVWTDLAIWAMQYVGPPYVYQFNEIGAGCGLIARKAAASMNGIVYWMGQSQFFKLSGSGVEIIKCPVWDVIFQDLDTTNKDKIRIAPNSQFGEVTWYYPTTTSGGEVAKYVKYNVVLDQWDFGSLVRTAWINQSVLGPPIGAGIAGGADYIYQHETSPDADGAPLIASFQTGYFAMQEGEMKVFVDQVWPDMKWGYYGGAQTAHVDLTFYVADYPNDTPRVYGPYTMTSASTYLTPRFRGRLMSIKMESAPDEYGTWWRLGAVRYRVEQDGKF